MRSFILSLLPALLFAAAGAAHPVELAKEPGRNIGLAGVDFSGWGPSLRLAYGRQLLDDTSFFIEPRLGASAFGVGMVERSSIASFDSRAGATSQDLSADAQLLVGARASVIQHLGRGWGLPFLPFVRGSLSPVAYVDGGVARSFFAGDDGSAESSGSKRGFIDGSLTASFGAGVDVDFLDVFFARVSADLCRIGGATSVAAAQKGQGPVVMQGQSRLGYIFASAYVRPSAALGLRF